MSTPPDGEGAARPDGPSVPKSLQKARANELFHSLAPAIGVVDARRLTERLARLQVLLREAEDDAMRLLGDSSRQVHAGRRGGVVA